MKIEARIFEMAAADVMAMIPASEYARIKQTDDHPEFRVYAVAHEGESKGGMSTDGKTIVYTVKKWARHAIESIAAKMQFGMAIFNLHGNAANDHAGRQPIGEVVGRAVKTIGNTLYALAVAYIKPEYRKQTMDVASIEADVLFNPQTRNVDVNSVTGIALGDNSNMRPGFPGATLQAVIQEFDRKGDTMTAEDVKEAVKALRLRPSEVFGASELTADPVVNEHVNDRTKGEYAHRMRTDDALKKLQADFDARVAEAVKPHQEKAARYEGIVIKTTAAQKLASVAKERKLDEKQAKFLTGELEAFKCADEAKLDADLGAFIDGSLKKYNAMAELLGVAKPVDKAGAPPLDNTSAKPQGDQTKHAWDDPTLKDLYPMSYEV